MSYPSRNVDSSKSLDLPGKEYSGSGSQHGSAPPFKRPRNQYDRKLDSADIIPNPRTSQSQQNPLVNKGTGNIFYKTQLCKKKMQGNCSDGENCTYAHGLEDLHDPPPKWKELVRANGKRALDNDRRTQRGMRVCRRFISEKGCRFGEYCKFLHLSPNNTEMARPLPMHLSARSMETTGPMLEQRNDTGQLELQVPGSHTEAEIITDVHSFPKKALPQLVNDALPTKVEVPTQERENSGVLPKWKQHGVISTIYGDWPEDLIPPKNDALPTKAEVPTQERENSGVLPKWKQHGVISTIYGDWPEDLIPPENKDL